MTAHDEMLDNVAAYALGALPEHEYAATLAHLETCEECRHEYDLLCPVVNAIALSAELPSESAPRRLLKARILRAVHSAPRPVPAWAFALAAVACLAIVVLGAFAVVLNREVGRERALVAASNRDLDLLAASDARRYPFGSGQIVARQGRLYIALRALPAPPPGKIYQAWTLAKGSKRMSPSLTFRPSGMGVAVVRLPMAASSIIAVAVSVEPAGGSLQPTSKPIAVVQLRG